MLSSALSFSSDSNFEFKRKFVSDETCKLLKETASSFRSARAKRPAIAAVLLMSVMSVTACKTAGGGRQDSSELEETTSVKSSDSATKNTKTTKNSSATQTTTAPSQPASSQTPPATQTPTVAAADPVEPAAEEPPQEEEPQNEEPADEPLDTSGLKIQAGPWFMAPWNLEMPTANYLSSGAGVWAYGNPDSGDHLPWSDIDLQTGLPRTIQSGKEAYTQYYFSHGSAPGEFAGNWVLEAVGDAQVTAVHAENVTQVAPGRYEFSFSASSSPITVKVSSVGSDFQNLRVYRKEDEARVKQGKLWAGRFVDEVSQYDIVRSMDLQNTNSIVVTRADEIPPASYMFWGNTTHQDAPYQSLPHEAIVSLAMEANVSLWFQGSLWLGFPYEWHSSQVNENSDTAQNIARSNANSIIASDEWDKYADRFVAALEAKGYPENRPLYLSLGNEIWNYAGPFARNTSYGNAIGVGLYGGEWEYRKGYAALITRFVLAMEDALWRAGRNQNVVYVVEGHIANDWETGVTLDTMQERAGGRWSEIAPKLGVAVSHYWNQGGAWASSGVSPNDPDGIANWYLTAGPDQDQSVAWVVAKWRAHTAKAEEYGVKFIGAYEGGAHFEKTGDMSDEAYRAFVWGEAGARVNAAVLRELSEEFPDAILSNYALVGTEGSAPWFEGLYGASNPLSQTYEPYLRD